MSLIGALTKALKAGETAKKTAPFYSAVDEALANLKRPKGTGAEFLVELSKQPEVKKAELADRRLQQVLKDKGKMSKEEVEQILKENPPPKLQEREYNEKMVREEEDIKEELAQEMYGRSYDDLSQRERRPVFDESQRIMGEENGPIYGDYKTPGGKNYREILLKLPSKRPSASNYTDPAKYDADMKAFNASGTADYQSSHWKEDPNVLAHMRVQDRAGPNGEKILHVEEIQSDWHQAGRKKGYTDETDIEKQKAYDDFVNGMKERLYQKALMNGYNEQQASITSKTTSPLQTAKLLNEENKFEELRSNLFDSKDKVPDAPFKKNWHELAMKRLLNYAADNGYDSIAITPGAEQAKRFSLSKQLNEVMFDPNTGHLSGRDHNGKLVVAQQNVTMDNLPDYIGKEGAQKILQTPVDESGVHALRGADLEVGGEGMIGFYDKMLPDYLNTFGKPYGAQVGLNAQRIDIPRQEFFGDNPIEARTLNLHSFPITPEMRESIKQKGLPLYQQIGIPTAGAGAASQIPEEPEEGLAGGGSVAKMAALAKLAKLREEMAPRAAVVKDLMAKDSESYLRDVTPDVLTKEYIEQEIARMKARAEASQPEVKKAVGGAINYNTSPDMSDGGRIIQGAPFKRGGKVIAESSFAIGGLIKVTKKRKAKA